MNLKQFSWLPAVIIMIVIFYFSSKPAEQSDQSSLSIADGILKTYESISKVNYHSDQRVEKLYSINHIVRKAAHGTEYALLSIAVAFHLWVKKIRGKRLYLLPIFISAIYAATDEFHQLFVPGRGGQLSDVGIDTLGAVIGSTLFYLIVISFKNAQIKYQKS